MPLSPANFLRSFGAMGIRMFEALGALTAAAAIGCVGLFLVALGLAAAVTFAVAFAFFVALGHIVGDPEPGRTD